tara:strand:- start:951 stop:1247 length:297 start_codon:yes stop_codon:yes gene_type:complete
MRFLIAAALCVLGLVSMPLVDAVDNIAGAQVLSTKPGNAPADALARTLYERKHAKKLKASKGGAQTRTKNMFQLRKSRFDRKYGSEKAEKDIIRRMQK